MMTQSSRRYWWALLMADLLALGVSLYLTILHFQVLRIGFTGKSVCNISAYFNCDLVLMSRLSTIGTLPLAGIGLLFYIYLLGAIFYSRMASEALKQILTLPFLLVCLACLFSIFLAFVSMFQIHSFCLFCTSLYLLNILLFFFLKGTANFKPGAFMNLFKIIDWKKSLIYFGSVFLIGGIILHANHKIFAQEITDQMADRYIQNYFRQPIEKIDPAGRPFWGNPNAKIVIAEFSDFECPYCKLAAFNIIPRIEDYKDKVKLVFFNYPLDKACNPHMPRELHERSCAVAYAVHCADLQGKFWEYNEDAFDRQPSFKDAALLSIAKKLKLDLNQFQACLQDEATKQYILMDIEQGDQAKVQGTPTIFVNGRIFSEWTSKKIFHKLLNKLLLN